MKKVILAIAMVLVLLSVFIGAVLVHAVGTTSSGPSLTVTVMTSGLNVVGKNWGIGVPVNLFVDAIDTPDTPPENTHQVADVTPAGSGGSGGFGSFGSLGSNPSGTGWLGRCKGSFQLTIPLNGISVGPHTLIGVQDVVTLSAGAQSSLQVITPFTILITSPVDDRLWGAVASVEGQLDGTVDSLVSDIADALHNIAIVKVYDKSEDWNTPGSNTYTIKTCYHRGIRHVSLTIGATDLLLHGSVQIWVNLPSSDIGAQNGEGLNLEKLDTILLDGPHTYQFDTDHWEIVANIHISQNHPADIGCGWNVTTLQPQHEIGVRVTSQDTDDTTVEESVMPGPDYPDDTETPVNP